MNARTARTCPACNDLPVDREPLCSLCWGKVPVSARTALKQAARKLGYNPASSAVRDQHAASLAAAIQAARR